MRKNGSISLLLLCILILVSACQAVTPTPTLPPTRTPTPLPATATPVPTSKPTLEVDLNKLRGKQVKVAYPWVMDQNRVNQLIDDFNLVNAWGIRAVAGSFGSDDLMADAAARRLDANILIGKTTALDPQNQIA